MPIMYVIMSRLRVCISCVVRKKSIDGILWVATTSPTRHFSRSLSFHAQTQWRHILKRQTLLSYYHYYIVCRSNERVYAYMYIIHTHIIILCISVRVYRQRMRFARARPAIGIPVYYFLTTAAGHDGIWISRFGSESVTISYLLVFYRIDPLPFGSVHTEQSER